MVLAGRCCLTGARIWQAWQEELAGPHGEITKVPAGSLWPDARIWIEDSPPHVAAAAGSAGEAPLPLRLSWHRGHRTPGAMPNRGALDGTSSFVSDLTCRRALHARRRRISRDYRSVAWDRICKRRTFIEVCITRNVLLWNGTFTMPPNTRVHLLSRWADKRAGASGFDRPGGSAFEGPARGHSWHSWFF